MDVIKARDSRNRVNVKLEKIQRKPYQDIPVKLKHRRKVLKAKEEKLILQRSSRKTDS